MLILTKLGNLGYLGLILLIAVVVIIVVDIILYTNSTENDTISYIIKTWVNGRSFFLIFLWGALAGRFFLSRTGNDVPQDISGAIIVLGIALVLFVVGKSLKKLPISLLPKVLLFIAGGAIGHFFWSLS
jgi:hypothetical protein